MNNTQLNENEIRDLRQRGLINAEEFAFKAGDLIIAENPVTGEKRVVGQASMLSESTRRVLKG